MQSKKIYIKGMHCVSCEKLIHDEFLEIKNVSQVEVNRQENWVKVFYEKNEPKFSDLAKAARKYGYEASESKDILISNPGDKDKNLRDWIVAGIIVLVIFLGYRIFNNLGFFDALKFDTREISFGAAFLIGIVASLSSCLAVVGAVVIAFAEKYKSSGTGFYSNVFRPNLFFHIGRTATFFLLGGLLGMIGGEFNLSGTMTSYYTIFIAIIMFWLGLNILGIIPSISDFGIRTPKKLASFWDKAKSSEHELAPFLLGGVSFFLPCGFTQSMQLFALASGSFWQGGISMLLFALGTMPVLLFVGMAASWTRNKGNLVFQKVAGMMVVAFSLYMLNSGWVLRGVESDVITTKKDDIEISENTPVSQEEQVVKMSVLSSGFQPSILKIKKGIPVKWVISGDGVTGCTNRIIVPDLNISQNISRGENTIRFTPKTTGTIPFSCWMGMVRGKFIVE